MINNLIERQEHFRNNYKDIIDRNEIFISAQIFEKIVTGKLIIICQSSVRKIFEMKFIKQKKHLSVSDNKYWNKLNYYVVYKNIKLTKELYFQ